MITRSESRKRRFTVLILSAACLIVPLSSVAADNTTWRNGTTTPPAQEKSGALLQRDPRYHLSRGDVFDLLFPLVPEFNQTVTVQPDGYITLRDVGDLHVEGKTVPEIAESVRTAYGKILHAPVISVVLKDFEKPHFIAGGEVGHPGKYDLRSDTTITEAVAIAGGFTEKAKHSQVLLFRRLSDEWTEVKTVNIKEILHTKAISEDIHLQPGDMLFVPTSLIANIKRIIPTPGTGIYVNPTQF